MFYVNKGSQVPMDNGTWERMWMHAVKLNPDGRDRIFHVKAKQYVDDMHTVSILTIVSIAL